VKNKILLYVILWITCLTQTLFPQNSVNKLTDTDVFVLDEPGYHYFRIPSIVKTNNNVLLAFAEGRQNTENDGDEEENDIVLKKSLDNGNSWGDLIVVAEIHLIIHRQLLSHQQTECF